MYFFKSKWWKRLLEIGSPGGAGRNKTLSQREFDQLPLCLPPLWEQRRIAAVLRERDRSIDLTESLIAAKQRRKSALVGRVLFDTSAKRGFIRDIADVNPRNPRVTPDRLVSFVGMEDVSEAGALTRKSDRIRGDLGNGYTQFQDGDVLIAKITPCFENGKGALALHLTNRIGFGTTEFHVVRPHEAADADYIHQITLTSSFRLAGERQMTGSAGQRRVPLEFIEDFPIFIMDRKTRRTVGSLLAALDEELAGFVSQTVRLRQQRIGLLQRLLTGEWRLDERFEPQTPPEYQPTTRGIA